MNSSSGWQDEAGCNMDDGLWIVWLNPAVQTDWEVCFETVRQPIEDGGVNSRAAINLIIPPRWSGPKCDLLWLVHHKGGGGLPGRNMVLYSWPTRSQVNGVVIQWLWNPVQRWKESVHDRVEQEYLAYLIINNSNQKLHSQLKKNVAINYSKGNIEVYPSDIHKALTLMNEYKPLKLDVTPVPAQGTAFATTSHKGKG